MSEHGAETNTEQPDTVKQETVKSEVTAEQKSTGTLSNKDESEVQKEETVPRRFHEFTEESYNKLLEKEREHQRKEQVKKEDDNEGRLVDGEIVFDDVEEDEKILKDPKLADGQPLPESLGRFPKELDGVPLEEIDPYIEDKTFVIVSKKFKRYHIFRFSATKALFCLSPLNPLRRFCLRVISNQFFDWFILLTITLNCAFMMVPSPTILCASSVTDQANSTSTTSVPCSPEVNYLNLVPENIFQTIYTIEMLLKICARGFVLNKYTYLRDGWNWLDSIVVLLAYITLILEQSDTSNTELPFSGLKAFRVLRALKSISVVPGLRTIVNALLKSFKMLGEVMLLMFFCIAVFALLALQLYKGELRKKCVVTIPETYLYCNATHPGNGSVPCFDSDQTLRTYWLQETSNFLTDDEGSYVLCYSTDDEISGCPVGYSCLKAAENPNWNYTQFDNMPMAMLNTFQLVSLDFWENTYDMIILVNGPWNIFFFLMVVLLGSFYLLNLMLAVVFMAYVQEADVEAKLEKEKEEEERQKAKRKENTALLFDPKTLKENLMQKARMQAAANAQENGGEGDGEKDKKTPDITQETSTAQKSLPNSMPPSPRVTITAPTATMTVVSVNEVASNHKPSSTNVAFQAPPPTTVETSPKNSPFSSPKKSPIKRPTTANGQFLKTAVVPVENGPSELQAMKEEEKMELTELEGSMENLRVEHTMEKVETTDEDTDSFYDDLPEMDGKTERYLVQKYATLWLNRIRSEEDRLIDRNCLCCAKSGLPMYHTWMKLQNMVYKVANDGLFELFITLCIAVNTIIMASEYYNVCELCRLCEPNATSCSVCEKSCDLAVDSQREWLDGMPKAHTQTLDIANIVFTVIFTVEAIIKLTAFSKEYFSVSWNIFDLLIVALSLPDLIILATPQGSLKEFEEVAGIIKIGRLLRIIKLAQSWSTMRTLLGIIFGAFGALINLSIILLIIMFIFAVLGNQLFGSFYNRYEDIVTYPKLADYGGELPRWHFKTFPFSFLMVFRILCGEWVEPLWDCMRVADEVGCTFLFLATLILGNFMIFNLFLALLLNSFSSDKIKTEKADEGEGKLKKSLRRIYHCFNSSSCKKADDQEAQSMVTLNGGSERRMRRLQAIIGERKPSITVNGSQRSIHGLIEATEPRNDVKRNLSSNSLMDDGKSITDASSFVSANIELKPMMGNGHAKSRSGSIISILSNGTAHTGNGVLRNKGPEMSPCNLQQIESAFSTHREEYAKFETAVTVSPGGCANPARSSITPIIIAQDFSSGKSVEVTAEGDDSPKVEDNVNESRTSINIKTQDEVRASISKDNEEEMVAEDGHIVTPDCFWPVCHKNPQLDNCCTSTWGNFRLVCAKIVTHKAFEGFILFLIAASTIALCFEDIKLHEQPQLQAALDYLNVIFAALFFIEMVFKLLALGIKKYFTGFWSILDFIIVCVSVTDIAGMYSNIIDISVFRVMRTLRALRPLRAVSRWESMTIIVNALIFAMPAIANVFLVCFVFWLIFAILGVQAFRGKFHQCEIDGERVTTYLQSFECTTKPLPENLTDYKFPPTLSYCNESILTPLLGDPDSGQWHWAKLCMAMGGTWKRPFIHFDHLLASYLALYQTATFEGWMEVMESGVDRNPAFGGQPHRELSVNWYIFFVVFIIFGAFFTLNLFIGVIIDNFNALKKKYDGSYLAMFLTDQQRHYYNTLKKLSGKKPQKTIRRPKSKVQGIFYDIATNSKFEMTITVVILLNMVTMMIEYEPEPVHGTMSNEGKFIPYKTSPINHEVLTRTLYYINLIFTAIFVIEAMIKIVGLRLHYFRRPWNVFDFVVVSLSLLGILLEELQYENVFISPTLLRVVRIFRIGRVLRLVKAAKGIRKLLFALVISMPALFNIATLLFLFMFIFAIVGMTFFANVKHRGALTSTVNFETFGRSILLLFRLSTSAGWNDVLYPLMEETDCNSTHYIDSLGVPQTNLYGNCSVQPLAVAFFLVYLFISFMIIINMYIAVILENFTQAHEQEEIGITEDDFDMFYAFWEEYDPHATQYIKLESLSKFIATLEPPLGVPAPNSMAIVSFNLPIVEGDRVHCLDILTALVKRVLHQPDHEPKEKSKQYIEADEQLQKQIADRYKATFPHRQHATVLTTTMQRKKEDVAAKTLQRAWRKHKMKLNIMRIRELALETTSHHGSISRRMSETLSNIKERIGSAFSRMSVRRSSTNSARSIENSKSEGGIGTTLKP